MAGEPAAGALGLGLANFSRLARISICPKTYASLEVIIKFSFFTTILVMFIPFPYIVELSS